MAKGFDMLHVKSAVKARNKFDLSRTHLTTMQFGEIIPMFSEETVPGDQISINANYFSRLAPLAVPTYGKFSFRTMTAFVPYHQIAEDADAWLAGKTSWEGTTTKHRYILVRDLALFLLTRSQVVQTAAEADFYATDSEGDAAYYALDSKGKYYLKILNSLGYAIPQGINLESSSSWYSGEGAVKLSAYPLLAFFKAYNDYMSQSQRYNTSQLSLFLKNVKHRVAQSGFTTDGKINEVGLKTLFDELFLNYDNDYFTSAWQFPNRPLSANEGIGTALVPGTDPNSINEYVSNDSDGNYVGNSSVSDSGDFMLSQRALDFLKSFDDWVRRNNYSGSRAVQQVYSRFGIKTDDYRSNYAHILGTDVLPVQVGDVTATSPTTFNGEPVYLGDYAGKGIMSGDKGVSFKADDYGLLMIIGYFTVVPMNAFGFDRKVLRNAPLDYYNPEFDGIGAEAISAGEFYANPLATSSDTTSDVDVYGYTERYNSYRYGRDMITGEFRNYNPTADMAAWHTGRNLNSVRAAGNLVAQSSAINTLPQTDSEYNRMFAQTNTGYDHFYVTAHFDVSAIRPMLNLNQVVKLGEGDTAVPRNGNVIS